MNITSYIQKRETGRGRHQGSIQRKAELFLESRLTKTFVNKSCEISGRCRSTFVMQFSSDGTKIASTHGDHSVRVTEISTGKCLHTLHGHPRTPWCLAYHPLYSNILASGCLGGQVRIWDLYGHGCEVWQSENATVIASLAFHPTDKVLVIASGNTLYFWDWQKPEPFAKCSTGHEFERIRWIHFDSLGHMLYTGISNNISLHADEMTNRLPTRVVLRSQERQQGSDDSQSSRLGSFYDSIVNYYQDYRRGRILSQLWQSGPQGARGSTTSTGHGTTVASGQESGRSSSEPGIQRSSSSVLNEISETLSAMRRNELFDSYRDEALHNADASSLGAAAANYGQRSTNQRGRWRSYDHCSLRDLHRNPQPRQSVFSNLPESERDLLLHPPADPFLSSVTDQSSDPLLSSATESLTDGGSHNTESGTDRTHLESSITDSTANAPAISLDEAQSHGPDTGAIGDIEIPLEAVTRRYVRPQLCCYRSGNLATWPQDSASEESTSASSVSSSELWSSQLSTGLSANYMPRDQTVSNDLSNSATRSGSASLRNSVSSSESLNIPRSTAVSGSVLVNVPQSGHVEQMSGRSELMSVNSENMNYRIGEDRNVSQLQMSTVGVESITCTNVNLVSAEACLPNIQTTVNVTQSQNLNDAGGHVSVTQTSSITNEASLPVIQTPVNVPQSPLLTRFLKSSCAKSNQSSRSTSKVFPSIRERLQSSVALCPVTTSSGTISQSHTTGIPKVTIIMGSELEPDRSSQSLGARSLSQNVPVCNESDREGIASSSDNDNVRIKRQKTCDTRSVLNDHKEKFADVNSNSQATADCTRVTAGSANQLNTLTAGNMLTTSNSIVNSTAPQVESAMIPPVVVTSTSSGASLLQNVFHNSCGPSDRGISSTVLNPSQGRNNLSSSYRQRHGRFLPLMGPYLQSRGVNPFVLEPRVQNESTTATDTHPALIPLDPNREEGFEQPRSGISSASDNVSGPCLGSTSSTYLPVLENISSSNSLQRSVNSDLLGQSDLLLQPNENSQRLVQGIHCAREQNTSNSAGQRLLSRSSQGQTAQGQSSRLFSQGNEVELVVDQNENYTTNRNLSSNTERNDEIVHRNHDSNNNSIHIAVNANTAINSVSQDVDQRNRDYIQLRDSFVSMTDQIEREMNDLNRRINALRESFNESIRSLRHDRHRYESLDGHLPAETATNLGSRFGSDETVGNVHGNRISAGLLDYPGTQEPDTIQGISAELGTALPVSQPPSLLETSLRSHVQVRRPLYPRLPQHAGDEVPHDGPHWRTLHRQYLHPHYSSTILDETINRPNNVIQSAINRAIAGAFMGAGESNVANNIMSQTHRIQFWDFTKCQIPDISQSKINIVVPHCKLHNSASADISLDNSLLATFVPNHQGFPDNNILAVYSLLPATRGQCLYTKQFGPNAVSVSISPSNNYVLVCLAARRLTWVFSSQQLVGQIFKLEKKHAGEDSMKHIRDVDHLCNSEIRTHVSGNSARWLPLPGQGLVYGTNRGDLNICRHGVKVLTAKVGSSDLDSVGTEDTVNSLSSLLSRSPWGIYSGWNRVNTSTQTGSSRLNAGTQTPGAEDDADALITFV